MTPLSQIFQLPITSVLDYETLGRVLKAGHSRIPVYEEVIVNGNKKNKVIGVLLTKQLILLDPEGASYPPKPSRSPRLTAYRAQTPPRSPTSR